MVIVGGVYLRLLDQPTYNRIFLIVRVGVGVAAGVLSAQLRRTERGGCRFLLHCSWANVNATP